MTKNSNRKGLALGAIFALVSSLFVSAPAAQANETGVVVQPIVGTSYTMVNTEDFILATRLGSQVQADRAATLKYIVAKSGTAGYGVSISNTVSATAQAPAWNTTFGSTISSMATTSTVSVVAPLSPVAGVGTTNQLRLQLWSFSALTSVSPALSVTVTAFLDLDGSDSVTGTEPSTVVTVSFVKLADIGGAVTLTQPVAGDTWATASAVLTGVNYQQLGDSFYLGFKSTADTHTAAAGTGSATVITPATLAEGNYSASAAIRAATASALVAQSVSAVLYYGTAGDDTIVKTSKLGVTGTSGFDGFTFSGTVDDNFVYTGSSKNTADIRVNSKVSLAAWAYTGSKGVVSETQATKYWFAVSGLSTDKYIIVNGVTYTDSAKLPTASTAVAVTAGTKGAIALETVGFSGNETITFNQLLGDKSATLTLTVKTAEFDLESDAGLFAVVAPGASTQFSFKVTDQFDVLSARTNQRVSAYTFAASGFSTSTTVSSAVVGGKATVAVSTLPATATGSATLRASLQRLDENTGAWVVVDVTDVALTVTSSAQAFSAAVSPTTSAVSISYDASAYSWSDTITVTTNVAGAVVTVAAKDLVIHNTTGDVTASDTIVARSGAAGSLTLKFAGKKAGKYTVSYTVGSTTTTSQIVVADAVIENASTINFDKSTLTPGETNVIVATLVDKHGNPIESTDKVDVVYTGKGLPFNIGKNVDTDEDGQFTFQVLVLAGETGAGTITATIRPTTDTDDNISVAKTLNIVTPAAPAVPEVNAVIGSFNNRVAVRVENAKGSAVSVKVGARWFKYTSLNDNYLWTVRSAKGRTVAVAVYVNGTLENVATITVK